MNKCLQTAHVPEWMTKGTTTFIQKDPNKGTAPNNYRPITCLPMMCKILTAQIREEIYYSLTNRWRNERMLQRIQRHSRTTLHSSTHPWWEQNQTENLAMAWIDYKKAYDMVLHSWIINSLKMYTLITLTIHDCHDTTKPHTQKMHCRIQTQ